MAPDEVLSALDALLGALPWPALMVDAAGLLVAGNSKDQDLLRSRAGICLDGKEVHLACEHADGMLRQVLRAGANGACVTAAIPLLGADGTAPIIVRATMMAAPLPGCFLLTMHELARSQGVDPCMLVRLFNLTPAEARAATAIGEGCGILGAADRLGVSEATIRFQLKAVFRKLRINRQQDLVRLLTKIADACATCT